VIRQYEPETVRDVRVIAYPTPEYETVQGIVTRPHSNSE